MMAMRTAVAVLTLRAAVPAQPFGISTGIVAW
jgi:hypothetical protein